MAEAATIEAPSAGALATESTGAAEAASPIASEAPLTDDQILGIGQEAGAPESGQVAEPSADDGAGEQAQTTSDETLQPNAEETAQQPQTRQGALAPEVKDFFKSHPEVRDAYYRAQEFQRLFPDFKAAEKLADMAAAYDNPAQIAEDLQGVAELKEVDGLFFSGDPEDQSELVGNMFRNAAENTQQLIANLPDSLRRIAASFRDSGDEAGSQAVTDAWGQLNRNIVENVLSSFHQKATSEGNDEVADVLAAAARHVLGREPWSMEAKEERIQRLQAEQQRIADSRRQSRSEQTQQWVEQANTRSLTEVTNSIKSTVNDLVGSSYSEEARNMLVGEIYRRVSNQLEQDGELVGQVQALVRGGAGDQRVQQALVRLVTNTAKRRVPSIAEKVIGAFGAGTLATTERQTAQREKVASRADVTGSTGLNAQTVKVPEPADLRRSGKYNQLSDDDILEGRF